MMESFSHVIISIGVATSCYFSSIDLITPDRKVGDPVGNSIASPQTDIRAGSFAVFSRQEKSQVNSKVEQSNDTQSGLSGTYTGTINHPNSGLKGDASLTIIGEQFTLTSGSTVYTGRIVDVSTKGYKTVTLQFDNTTSTHGGQAATPPTTISLRLQRAGDKLTFLSGEGEEKVNKPAGKQKKARRRRANRSSDAHKDAGKSKVSGDLKPQSGQSEQNNPQ